MPMPPPIRAVREQLLQRKRRPHCTTLLCIYRNCYSSNPYSHRKLGMRVSTPPPKPYGVEPLSIFSSKTCANPPSRSSSPSPAEDYPPRVYQAATEKYIAPPCPLSCIACRERKVKCNRDRPCSACLKGHKICSYPPKTKRRSRGPGKKNNEEMRTRVVRLECLLEKLGRCVGASEPKVLEDSGPLEPNIQKESLPGKYTHSKSEAASFLTDSGRQASLSGCNTGDTTRLLVMKDQSLYISNAFWASLSKEVGFQIYIFHT
jgi:hypothetical protein